MLATLLLYRVALRTTDRIAAAWAGAMLFALLPAHAEAVGWIQGRVDLVSTTLLLLALLALLRARETAGRTGWEWVSLAGLAFLGALLSKESAAALPLIWAVWEVSALERDGWRKHLAEAAPRFASLALAMLVYWTLRHAAVGALVGFPMSIFPVGQRLLALLTVHGDYVWTLFVPSVALNFHVGLPAHLPPASVLIGLMVAGLLGGGLILTWRYARPLLPWMAWIPIMLLPPLCFTLYAPAPLVGYYTAERFLYLPSVGWCVLLGFLFARLMDTGESLGRASWGLVTFGGMLVGYAVLLLARLLPWGDAVDLYAAMKAQPGMSEAIRIFVRNDLGRVYLERGEFMAAQDEFQAALRLKPDYASAHNNMGVLLIQQGKPADALRWLEAAIRLDPVYANSYGNLGAAFEALDDLGAARRAYEAGLRVSPGSAWLAKGLARVTAVGGPALKP